MCPIIVDSGTYVNVATLGMVKQLKIHMTKHPTSYKLQWFNDKGGVHVEKRVMFLFYFWKNMMMRFVVPMATSHIILGKPWMFDRFVVYNGFYNTYSFKKDGRMIKLHPMSPVEIKDLHNEINGEKRSLLMRRHDEWHGAIDGCRKSFNFWQVLSITYPLEN